MLFGSLLLLWRTKPEKPCSSSLSSCFPHSLNATIWRPLYQLKKRISPHLFLLFPFLSLTSSDRAPLSLAFVLWSPLSRFFLPSHFSLNLKNWILLQTHLSFNLKKPISQTNFSLGHFKNPTDTDLERQSWHGVVERQSRFRVVTGGGVLGSTISVTFLALSSLGFMLVGFWVNGVH